MDNNSKELFKLIDDGKTIVHSDPRKAYEITKEAYKLAESFNNKSAMGYCFINFALIYRSLSNFANWVEYGHHALDILVSFTLKIKSLIKPWNTIINP